MISTKIQFTQKGLVALQNELKELIKAKRPVTVEKLQKARSMGDLAENSAYTTAREELALLEGRIQELQEIIKNAEIVDTNSNKTIISIGNMVTAEINGVEDKLQVVGEFEADPMNKKLSHTSPIGKALIGKKVGDIIEIEIPTGKITYKILSISS